jgi:hypothetical protein
MGFLLGQNVVLALATVSGTVWIRPKLDDLAVLNLLLGRRRIADERWGCSRAIDVVLHLVAFSWLFCLRRQ